MTTVEKCLICGRKRPCFDYEDEMGEVWRICYECAEQRKGE